MFSFIPLKLVWDRWPLIEMEVLHPFFHIEVPMLYEGTAGVRLREDVELFPIGTIPAGTRGVVVSRDSNAVRVLLDNIVTGLEDWDNELHWDSEVEALDQIQGAGPSEAEQPGADRDTMDERVLRTIRDLGPGDDDEIAARLGVIRQHVNQAARRLADRGVISRKVGPSGKLTNSPLSS